MIEIFNRLQRIFGRPITLVYIDDCILEVQLSWWSSEVFTITPDVQVYDCVGSCDANTVWLQGLLQGAKRNDAGELVQQCES